MVAPLSFCANVQNLTSQVFWGVSTLEREVRRAPLCSRNFLVSRKVSLPKFTFKNALQTQKRGYKVHMALGFHQSFETVQKAVQCAA